MPRILPMDSLGVFPFNPPMATTYSTSALGLLRRTWPQLLAISGIVYGPYYLLYAGLSLALASSQSAEMMLGVLGAFLLPIVNGAVVYTVDQVQRGRAASLKDAFQAAFKAWRRLFVVYLSISFVFVGYLAIWALPGGLLVLGLRQYLNLDFNPLIVLLPLAIPAFFVMTRYPFVDPLAVLEGLEPYDVRQQSRLLADQRRRVICLYAVFLIVPLMGLELAAERLGSLLAGEDGTFLAVSLGTFFSFLSAILNLIPTLIFYIMYKDLREQPGGLK